jgi:2-keto-3-deoxy-L-rhamnonate aldolase RhmA
MPNRVASDFILTAITRDPEIIRAADEAGVDRIGIDIERLNKAHRQSHVRGARVSDHVLDDLASVARNVTRAQIFIRVNPIHAGSSAEIEQALALGARVVMLPYLKTTAEAACFIDLVGGRATPVLLLETAAAVARLRPILAVQGVGEIMVGLNDLSLSLGLDNPFEVVVSDLLGLVADRVRAAGMRFGFGGLARVDDAKLPVHPDLVCAQYSRLGATSAWLSRSFFNGIPPCEIAGAVRDLRARLAYWAEQPPRVREQRRGELEAALTDGAFRPV